MTTTPANRRHRTVLRGVVALCAPALWLSASTGLVGVLGTPTAAATGDGWSAVPVSSRQAADQPCASVLFVGARGSGEPAPYGDTVTGLRDAFHQRVVAASGAPGWLRSVRQVYVDYPATSPYALQDDLADLLLSPTLPDTAYFTSARDGSGQLTAVVEDSVRRCPSERIVLAGFSQGAQVVTRTLSGVDLGDKLLAAYLMGDPSLHPGEASQKLSGDAEPGAMGLVALLYYLRSRAYSTTGLTRKQALDNEVRAAVNLSRGDLVASDFASAMTAAGENIRPGAFAHVYSICWKGDMVCDAVAGMTRVLTSQATLAQEIDATRAHHLAYKGTVLNAPLDATLAAAEASTAPVVQDRGFLQRHGPGALAAGIGILVGLAAGLLLGRVRRRRPRPTR